MRAITFNILAFLVFLLIVVLFVVVDPILAKGGKDNEKKEEKPFDCWEQKKGERKWDWETCKEQDTKACIVAKGCPNGDEIRGCITKDQMKDAKKTLKKKIKDSKEETELTKDDLESKKDPKIVCQKYKEIDGCTGECKICTDFLCNGAGKIGGGQNWMVIGVGGMVWVLWMVGHLGAMQGIGPI